METIPQLYQLLLNSQNTHYSDEINRLFMEHFCVLHYENQLQGVMIWNQTTGIWTYVYYDQTDKQAYFNTIDHLLFPTYRTIHHQQELEYMWFMFRQCIRLYLLPNESSTHQMFKIHCLTVYPNFTSQQNLVKLQDQVIERKTLQTIPTSREQYLHWSIPITNLEHRSLNGQMNELISSLKASFFMESENKLNIIRTTEQGHRFIVELLARMFPNQTNPRICMDMEDLFINRTVDHEYITLTSARIVFNQLLHDDIEICKKLLTSSLKSMHFICQDVSAIITHCENNGIDYSVIRFDHQEDISPTLLESIWYYMLL
jgi:hypothetical protein